MKTFIVSLAMVVLTAGSPQYRPISPISPLLQRASISPISPLATRTPLSSISPLASLSSVAPIVPPGVVVKPTSQLKVAGARDDAAGAIILRFENDNNGIDGYSYAYETSDGQFKEEQGQLLNPGIPDAESIAVRGQYSFIAPDGVLYTVAYTADENGFQPHAEQVARTL